MKKSSLVFICFLSSFVTTAQSNLFYDTFNYSTGSLISNAGGAWANNTGTSNQLQVSSGSLTYSNNSIMYWPNASDGKIEITTIGTEDVKTAFTSTSGSGTTIYSSFLINVSAAASTAEYFAHFISGNTQKGRIWGKRSGTGFDIGLSSDGAITTYTSSTYAFGTTHLIVVSYTFNSGLNDDAVNLWINPDLSTASGPPAATISNLIVATDYSSISGFGFRQAGSTKALTASLDGIKIGTSWGTSVLPICLIYFTGKQSIYGAELNWATASEKNNSHYEILRSADGNYFYKIAGVTGNNSSQTRTYSYNDKTADAGTNYYQLKQVDFDAQYKIYGPIAVKSGLLNNINLKVYASADMLQISLNASVRKDASLMLFDIGGHQLHKTKIAINKGSNTFILPSPVYQGLYFIIISGPELSLIQKFVN